MVAEPKLHILIRALREATIIVLAAFEDYLDVGYDKSALAKRRKQTYGKETTVPHVA